MERIPPCWDLYSLKNKEVVIHLDENRVVEGILRGFDTNGNLVLAETKEISFGKMIYNEPRKLGGVIVRSPHIFTIDLK